ncbi:methyl-accepting chemotaxis protein [Novosphingobium sediminicola]|uniref:Methyl-accepting chemotaxis protein n=1 Tax=Novosphingobium sediminicola TaxID=563162 RepID=A0A7W6CJG9_9SPHN|nr:HAMP domain-containing methyl-accepting chemotaxis protein [Novosphingobium sediminicola]MBB3956565.1 methyl-accepting chemotaxis protein [Novosphingobium sediminicola]
MKHRSIARNNRIGAMVILSVLLAAGLLAGLGFNDIRLGGSLHHRNQQVSDFVADILPPPEYVIEGFLEASLLHNNPGLMAEKRSRLGDLERAFRQRSSDWAASDLDADLKQQLAREAQRSGEEFWAVVDQDFLPALSRGDAPVAQAAYDRLSAIYATHRGQIEALTQSALLRQKDIAASSATMMWAIMAGLGALGMVLLGLILGALRWQSRHVLEPLAQTAQVMSRMASGDLDVGRNIHHREDEIGAMTAAIEVFRAAALGERQAAVHQQRVVDSLSQGLQHLAGGQLHYRIHTPLGAEYESLRQDFNGAMQELGEAIGGVMATAASVEKGASEIRGASDDLARRNETHATTLEEMAATMDQVTHTIRESASHAVHVQSSITQTHQAAVAGGNVVARATAAMTGIERSSQEINQIINVIDGIAFQTNLLALNAGVEAARAGDAGKGFAVVANEVRALAQRSAGAAKDIKVLIHASTDQVLGGVALVRETGAVLGNIVEQVGHINTQVSDMTSSTELQATYLSEINKAIAHMDGITQQNAAMSEQATAAARSLATQAQAMNAMVGRFETADHRRRDWGREEPVPFVRERARERGGERGQFSTAA